METSVEYAQGNVPVTILAVHGELDASNFEALITNTRELYEAGTRYLLLDLSQMSFMGSSGLVALYSIVELLSGKEPPDPEYGWQAFHTIEQGVKAGKQLNVKLLNPQPKVAETLHLTGMDEFFEIYTDRQTAVQSF